VALALASAFALVAQCGLTEESEWSESGRVKISEAKVLQGRAIGSEE
jgi:hypothetical protein